MAKLKKKLYGCDINKTPKMKCTIVLSQSVNELVCFKN